MLQSSMRILPHRCAMYTVVSLLGKHSCDDVSIYLEKDQNFSRDYRTVSLT
jgi:hypothetical protein